MKLDALLFSALTALSAATPVPCPDVSLKPHPESGGPAYTPPGKDCREFFCGRRLEILYSAGS